MAPSRFYSLRGRPSNPASASASSSVSVSVPVPLQSRHIPSASADDSLLQFVAFRYEETIQAEPPIPIPPPRNPLRNSARGPRPRPRPATTIDLAKGRSNSVNATAPAPAIAATQHIIVPPPHPIPLPLPLHLAVRHDNHPALRIKDLKHLNHQGPSQSLSLSSSSSQPQHSPSSSSTTTTSWADWKRDSALGTLSSASTTLPDDDYKDDTCVKLDLEDPPSSKYSTDDGSALATRPPQRASTTTASTAASTSTSTSNHSAPFHNHHLYNAHHVPRLSNQSRWSLTDSEVSDSESFIKDKHNSTRRLIRGLSLRLAPPMKRMKKPAQAEATAAPSAVAVAMALPPPTPNSPTSAAPHDQIPEFHQSHQSHHPLQGSPAPHSSSPPNLADLSSQEIVHHDSQFPNSSHPGPLSDESLTSFPPSAFAPTINTDIPQGSLEDLEDLSFSKRGSIYFGATRATSAFKSPFAPEFMDKFTDPRAAPPTPNSPVDGASDLRPVTSDSKRPRTRQSKDASVPDIRVMSEDTERESQKVRSLYESTDLVHWEDGAPGRRSSELLEPPAEVPSDGESKIATPGSREKRKSVRAMYLSPTSPMSVTSLPSPRGSYHRRYEFELAGGIEDWQDVQGEDVDRYGFITMSNERPLSRASHPAETRSLHTSSGRRNGRNVLTKRSKGPPLSQGIARIPSRKVSARSLNTQASALSATSRLSVRSGVRTAANMLPHNRDRKIIDAAPDMLSLPPGLADIHEEQRSAQSIKAAQELESSRAEKWRKMAKIVTNVKDGKGTKVEAHNLKKDLHIKFDTEDLAKKGGKDTSKAIKHLEIQSMEIEFDTRNPKLIERTWKGIPDRWRSAAWYSFLSTSAKNANSQDTDEGLFATFHRLQEESSPDDLQIDLDVPRTINKHIMFRRRYRGGQRLLFRVLHAMSLHFPDIGYVQGMAALAASLLCYYDEERCFVMLVRLWQYRGLERLYEQGFAGLMIALQDLEKHWLFKKPLSQKLNDLGIDPTAYGTRWYLTLFNLSIPFHIQLRVWDVFMLLGGSPSSADPSSGKDKQKAKRKHVEQDEELVFNGIDILHATAAALIDMHKDVILDADFENVMKSLTGFQQLNDENQFIHTVQAEWNEHRKRKRG